MVNHPNLVKIDDLTPRQIASVCDHTFLNRSEAYRDKAKPGESPIALRETAFYSFLEGTIANEERLPYAVCVRPEDVRATATYLAEQGRSEIVIASVVGFPDGALYGLDFKLAETNLAIGNGAKEIDTVLNYKTLRTDYKEALREIIKITDRAHFRGALVKLILETSELSEEEIRLASALAQISPVDFVKTSTGFGAYGAREKDLGIMAANFSRGIKISGGVNKDNVRQLLMAASRRTDGYIDLNPLKIRIGESSLLVKL